MHNCICQKFGCPNCDPVVRLVNEIYGERRYIQKKRGWLVQNKNIICDLFFIDKQKAEDYIDRGLRRNLEGDFEPEISRVYVFDADDYDAIIDRKADEKLDD